VISKIASLVWEGNSEGINYGVAGLPCLVGEAHGFLLEMDVSVDCDVSILSVELDGGRHVCGWMRKRMRGREEDDQTCLPLSAQ